VEKAHTLLVPNDFFLYGPDADFCWFLVRASFGIVDIPGFREIEAGPNRREISNT
jgi:GT2 family glycosyltransferase